METRNLKSWSEFDGVIEEIRTAYGRIPYLDGRTRTNLILFRGEANAAWPSPLSTTLERASSEEFSLARYHWRALRCLAPLESITEKRWPEVPRRPEDLQAELDGIDPYMQVTPPGYAYLVYLRHHGYPSPLLDWSTSPYVAAYFAFQDGIVAKRVAVYAYIETASSGKGFVGHEPRITAEGPDVTTDPRHFAQKCWYTVATRYDEAKKVRLYCPHMAVFDRGDSRQDILWKITVPAEDRISALRRLEDFNIDHFTLFNTEDALVKSLMIRGFEL